MVLRDGAYGVSGATSGRWDELPAGTHVELASMGYGQDRLNGPVRDVAGALHVSDDVASLEIDAGGEIREATVADGVAMFWLSDGSRRWRSTQADGRRTPPTARSSRSSRSDASRWKRSRR